MKFDKGVFALFTALRCVGAEVITNGSRKQLRNLNDLPYEIYSAGEGGGICDSGYEVTLGQCLDAAHAAGGDMPLKTDLVAHNWPTAPCGCFVYNDWFVNYKDPSHGNCLAHAYSRLVCRQTPSADDPVYNFEMYSGGEGGGICESGYEVTEKQCIGAAHTTGAGMTLMSNLVVSDWDITPCGCFVHNDWYVNYKDPAHGNCIANEQSKLVCQVGGTSTSTSKFEIYADEVSEGVCTSGKAVTQEECFAAGHEVGIGMNLGDELIVYDWDWTPCGCFIYDNFLVDYKDPVHGSCTHHAKCKSVCRKEVGTQTETVNANPVTPLVALSKRTKNDIDIEYDFDDYMRDRQQEENLIAMLENLSRRGQMRFDFGFDDGFFFIKKLDISNANFGSEFGFMFVDFLIQQIYQLEYLEELNIYNTKVGDKRGQEAGVLLAKVLATNTTIKRLHLLNTDLIGSDNVVQWGDALMENKTLTRLDLHGVDEEIKDKLRTRKRTSLRIY